MASAGRYQDIFAERGARYLRALNNYPDARAEEFAAAVASARPEAGQLILDVPAGGGMLSRFLPPDCRVARLECAAGFSSGEKICPHARADGDNWPVIDQCAHQIISVAGVHHVEDKRHFFSEAWRCLLPGGTLLLAEVAANSPVAAFLDGFVDTHNPQGHHGYYLDDLATQQLQQAGFVIDSVQDRHYPWHFASEQALVSFCSDQFGLQPLEQREFFDQLAAYLSIETDDQGGINLPWQLRHIRAIKPAGFDSAQPTGY